ncbi:MAG: hypothetical protein WAW11_03220 [Patescibacteria group bacterium]
MFSYRSILSRAWKITRQHKKLWIFGAFAMILSAGGEYQILTKILNKDYGAGFYDQMQNGSHMLDTAFWSDFGRLCMTEPKLGFGIGLLMLLMAFVCFLVLWVSIKSQISIIEWVKNISTNKKKEQKISVWEGISSKDKKFWSILGLNITFKVGLYLLFVIMSIPLIFLFFQDSNIAILFYTIFFTVFLPLAISLALIVKYAMISVVLEKNSFVKSIEKGIKTFTQNWLVSLEIAILLFLINFLVGLLIVFIVSLVILPMILTMLVFNFLTPLYLLIAIGFLVLVLTAAILMTFQTAVWTILFEELKKEDVKAKLERVFKRRK